MELWREIAEVRSTGDIAALCTIVNTSGSVPRHIGAKMLVYADGKISGTIGGGNLEKKSNTAGTRTKSMNKNPNYSDTIYCISIICAAEDKLISTLNQLCP